MMEFIIIKSIARDNFKTSIILTILTLIITIISFNKFKILITPFVPNDVLLIGNIGEIAKFSFSIPIVPILIMAVLFVLMLSSYYKRRKKYYVKTKITLKTDWYRVPLFLIGIALLYYTCISPDRFERLGISNSLENDYEWYGGNATFFLHLGDSYSIKPSGYTQENIEKIKEEVNKENEKLETNNNVKPNVIIIMNESFTDPNKIKDVWYSINPLENITKLKEEDKNCIVGTLITPVDGGGTSLPEFEVLTGMTSYYLQKQVFPYTSYINKDMNSVVRTYLNNGYETIGIHTFRGNFYNRNKVYKYLGFNKTVFQEDIENPEIKGGYISDNEFANQIIKAFKETKQSKFIFGVTMQNHMHYVNKAYNESELEIEISSDTLTERQKKELRNYVQGVYDGDKMYEKIVEYLKTIEEPTILMMFGDHRPSLSSKEILESSVESIVDRYSTPYIIWANYDIDYSEELSEYMSPGNLSLAIMKLAKIEIPWYFQEFRKLYEEYPAINNQLTINKDYKVVNPEYIEKDDIIKKCEILQYDLLIKKKYIMIDKR